MSPEFDTEMLITVDFEVLDADGNVVQIGQTVLTEQGEEL
jgi:hypothetical protein